MTDLLGNLEASTQIRGNEIPKGKGGDRGKSYTYRVEQLIIYPTSYDRLEHATRSIGRWYQRLNSIGD